MGATVGIRREDKNRWERRVPLIPADLAALVEQGGIDFLVQTSPIRVFGDDEFQAAGIRVVEDLDPAGVVLAVKEIPLELLRAGRTYLFFSHVIKGQSYNMPLLARLMELGCTLIDYERITDHQGRRMIFFSLHAGYAGAIESLRALGLRLAVLGRPNELTRIKQPHEYADLSEAKDHLRSIGADIAERGLGEGIGPQVIGLAGYGNVAIGCREILACLPIREVEVSELPAAAAGLCEGDPALLSVVFKEEHMVLPVDPAADFRMQDYYDHPEKYVGRFEKYLPHLDLLINAIYWEDRYPRLVTREWVAEAWADGAQPRLKVIGDISCDIGGGVEVTVKAPMPDAPSFVYDPVSGAATDGVEGHGPVVMAVDNLPCELPRESSALFSSVLRDMVPALAQADWEAPLARLGLPAHLYRAVVVHRGELAPDFEYLKEFLSDQQSGGSA